jgi:hypothetical protein
MISVIPAFDYVLETKGMQKDFERVVMRALAVFRLFKDGQIVCELPIAGRPPRGSVSFRHFIPWSRIKIDHTISKIRSRIASQSPGGSRLAWIR